METLYQSLVAVEPVTLIANICNLFIQMLIVKKFFLDKIMAVLDQRRSAADKEISDAKEAKDEAMSIKKTYEDNMLQANAKANEILASAQKTAAERSEKIIGEAQQAAAQTGGIDPVFQQNGLAGQAGQLLSQGLELGFRQGNRGNCPDAQNIVVFVVKPCIGFAAMGEVVHIALFGEDFQEVQHILVDFPPKTVIQDLAALLLGNGVAAEQLDKAGLLTKAFVQSLQLLQDALLQALALGQLIQGLSIDASNLGHT